jgi:hypothetical protein
MPGSVKHSQVLTCDSQLLICAFHDNIYDRQLEPQIASKRHGKKPRGARHRKVGSVKNHWD